MSVQNAPLRLVAAGALARPPCERRWSIDSDLRWGADAARALFYVSDASGPTYGDHHPPFGVDLGLAAFVAAFDAGGNEAAIALRAAHAAAHVEMSRRARARTLCTRHLWQDAAVGELLATLRDGGADSAAIGRVAQRCADDSGDIAAVVIEVRV